MVLHRFISQMVALAGVRLFYALVGDPIHLALRLEFQAELPKRKVHKVLIAFRPVVHSFLSHVSLPHDDVAYLVQQTILHDDIDILVQGVVEDVVPLHPQPFLVLARLQSDLVVNTLLVCRLLVDISVVGFQLPPVQDERASRFAVNAGGEVVYARVNAQTPSRVKLLRLWVFLIDPLNLKIPSLQSWKYPYLFQFFPLRVIGSWNGESLEREVLLILLGDIDVQRLISTTSTDRENEHKHPLLRLIPRLVDRSVVMPITTLVEQAKEGAVCPFHHFHGLVAKVGGDVLVALRMLDFVPHFHIADELTARGIVLLGRIHCHIVNGTATTAQQPQEAVLFLGQTSQVVFLDS